MFYHYLKALYLFKKLKGASQAHAGQAKDLEKAVSEKVEPSRIVEPYRPEFGLDEISTFSRAHIAILKKTFDPMRDKRLGPKGQAKLSKIMDSSNLTPASGSRIKGDSNRVCSRVCICLHTMCHTTGRSSTS